MQKFLENVLAKLAAIEHLPCHPYLKNKILDFIQDFDFHSKDSILKLSRLVSLDPSLSIEFLKIANKDSYGYKNKISSVYHAFKLMDIDLIMVIIKQHPVLPRLEVFDATLKDEFSKLVIHSFEVRIITEELIKNYLTTIISNEDSREELLLAASIHDIGLFFLLCYFPALYKSFLKKEKQANKSTRQKMPKHSFLGSLLCQQWNLPDLIKTITAFHHNPQKMYGRFQIESQVLFLADQISPMIDELHFIDKEDFKKNSEKFSEEKILSILKTFNIKMDAIFKIQKYALEQRKEFFSGLT